MYPHASESEKGRVGMTKGEGNGRSMERKKNREKSLKPQREEKRVNRDSENERKERELVF